MIKNKIEIKKQINALEDKAIIAYNNNDMKKGKFYEKKSDDLYAKEYSTLFPEYAEKLREIKKRDSKKINWKF